MTDNDPRDDLLRLAEHLATGTVLPLPLDREAHAQALAQTMADLLPSISESEARLIAEALRAAYQLGRLSP